MCTATLRRTSQTAGRLVGCADETAESPADEGADEGANGGTDAAARHAEAHPVAAERGTTEAVDAFAGVGEARTESPDSARDSRPTDEYPDTRTIAHRSQAERNAACARSFTDLDPNEATDETTDAGHGERFDEAFEQADADESPADDAAESEARSRASAVTPRSVPTGAHSHGTLSSHYDATLA